MYKIICILSLLLSFELSANWSASVTLANNYLFNGVSQTNDKAALQVGINYATNDGFYVGSWGSNVDLDNTATIELDGYAGYSQAINDELYFDLGASHYTYQGKQNSNEMNYSELYMKWNFKQTDINFWYAWDYFGTGARHYIVMLNHMFKVNDKLSVLVGIDKSVSLDSDQWQWQANDRDYIHKQLMANFSYHNIDFSIGIQSTDLNSIGETQLLFTLTKALAW